MQLNAYFTRTNIYMWSLIRLNLIKIITIIQCSIVKSGVFIILYLLYGIYRNDVVSLSLHCRRNFKHLLFFKYQWNHNKWFIRFRIIRIQCPCTFNAVKDPHTNCFNEVPITTTENFMTF